PLTGADYVYTIKEDEVLGYSTTIDGFNVTNTQKVTTQDVSKVWINETGDENPTEVTAILLRDGEEYKEVVLNEENGWMYTWEGLPLTDLTGREYVYTVEEKEVPGYTTAIEGNVITNTRDIIEIDVTKIWVDESGNLDKPESIEFILYRNEVEYKRLALAQDDDEDTWMATFENLPKTDLEGNDYIYTIDEVLPAGYEKVIEEFSITNTRILVTIPVTKVWKTVEDKLPQQITYKLFRNGEEIAEYVASNPEWNYTFEVDGQGLKLPKTNPLDGTDYVYTITEEVVDGYEVSIEGFEVTNTQLTTEIEVSKVWINGPDAKATIELRRSADDVEDTDFVRVFKATKEVTKTTFTELPTHNPDGVEYKYYVVETQIPENFEVKYLEDGLTVENEYVIPTNGKAEAIKVWENAPEQKPTVWFKLFRQIEGAEAQAVPETPIKELANGTTVVAWEELEETDINGNPYTFSVKEVNEKGEDFVPDHYEKTETGLTVTNKYFENPNIEFEKSTKEKEYVEVGQVITYQFRVKNTGDVVLTNIRLTDEMLGIKDKLIAEKLEAGQEVLFEVTYKVTEKDIKAKNIKNIATIHADTPVKKDIPITTTNIIPANPKPKDDPAPKTGDGGAGMYLIILGASSIMLYVLVMNKKKSFKEDVK
ncbi:MAG: Cna B-type domain-containing protein, partial [Tissierellia bacterium]|nr:Cna B-type domain-containing protein [Tissierellia bacterium]